MESDWCHEEDKQDGIFHQAKLAKRQVDLEEILGDQDRLEGILTKIWKKVLGVKRLSRNDDFFELGGHSLLAAQLFAELEKALGRNIPLSTLFEAPTIAQLGQAIVEKKTARLWSPLVAIRSSGTKPPLFLVHGAEGNVLLYRTLAQHLGPDQPVYGLQSEALDGREHFETDFRKIAARYVEEIRKVQAEGPYFLGGYCMGGTLALEMAHQLKCAGEKVALLAMIEIYNIQTVAWPFPLHVRGWNGMLNLWYHLRNLLARNNVSRSAFFRQKARVEISRMRVSLKVAQQKLLRLMGRTTGAYVHLKIDKIYDRALEDYYPPRYEGKITLFVPKTLPAGFTDPNTYGFREVAEKGVSRQEIPTYPRGTLVEPYVQILAERLTASIEEANEEFSKTKNNA